MNPFSGLMPPVKAKVGAKFPHRQLMSLLDAPPESSAAGVRDQALLQLLCGGIFLSQLHRLDLRHIDPDGQSLVVVTRSGDQELVLLNNSVWTKLQRWLSVRRFFAVRTEAVFLSLHWTSGRAQPGSRLSERGMRSIVAKYLDQVGAIRPGINSYSIAKSADICRSKIPRSLEEIT